MNRVTIMACDCAPVYSNVVNEIEVVDGRLTFIQYPGFDTWKNWVNATGATTLDIPHKSIIKGMNIRGRVAHPDALFEVSLVKVPHGSHPSGPFEDKYKKDEPLGSLLLSPSANDGYIHHSNHVAFNHKVNLIDNSYYVEVRMALERLSIENGTSDLYLTDIEVFYEEPEEEERPDYKFPPDLNENDQERIRSEGEPRDLNSFPKRSDQTNRKLPRFKLEPK